MASYWGVDVGGVKEERGAIEVLGRSTSAVVTLGLFAGRSELEGLLNCRGLSRVNVVEGLIK